jgi:hypothetical protein
VSVEHRQDEDRLWIGVTDTGAGNPLVRRPPVTAEHGRGLQLLGLLSDRWGVRRRRDSDAKTVRFELTGATTSTHHAASEGVPARADDAVPRRPSPTGSPPTPGTPHGRPGIGRAFTIRWSCAGARIATQLSRVSRPSADLVGFRSPGRAVGLRSASAHPR